jgi:aryl-alcohol dehydrogenase-like predicted oxidoreductase
MSATVGTRILGKDGPAVSAVGLGCMSMSDVYARPDEEAGHRTILAALDAGVTMLNTGDFYGNGRNELLIGRAIKGRRHEVFLSVKAGAQKSPDGEYIGFDMRATSMKNYVAHSLTRLGTDYIDLYQPSRVDPRVPIEETVGALADLVKQGWVRYVGLSEAGPSSIRRAHAVHPISAHEVEYSLFGRDIEDGLLEECRNLGIATVCYSVLAGGLLGGNYVRGRQEPSMRDEMPRFQAGNLDVNLALVDNLSRVAAAKGVTVAALSIAWVMAQGVDLVPLVGVRRPDKLADAISAAGMRLTAEELAGIDAAIPRGAVAGKQYGGFVQNMIERERAVK